MKTILFFLLSICSYFASAQNANYKNILTLSTSSIFAGRVDLGLMHHLNREIWLGAEIGYGSGMVLFFDDNSSRKNSSSFRISPEIYYDVSPDAKSVNLFSLQFFYTKSTAQLFDGDFYNKNGSYNYTSANFDKTRTGVNLNYSILFNRDGTKFTIMPKIGVGLRHKKIKFSNIVDLEETYELVDSIPFLNREEGSNIRPNVNFDIKFIYRF